MASPADRAYQRDGSGFQARSIKDDGARRILDRLVELEVAGLVRVICNRNLADD
jgi:hypothetical protein